MRTLLVVLCFFGLGLGAAHAAAPPPDTLNLAVAANMSDCVDALDAEFLKQAPGATLKVSTGASGVFYAQIKNGAPFDVFISADMDFPRKLTAEGEAQAETLKPYAYGRLALWTTVPGINPGRGWMLLVADYVKKIAIANPDTAPYGRAAMAVFEHLGFTERVKDKLVIGENIAQALQFTQTGNADLGFVAYSQLLRPSLRGVGVYVLLPENSYPPIEQGAVVTRHGKDNPLAARYLKFLAAPEAREILTRFGYGLPEGEAAH